MQVLYEEEGELKVGAVLAQAPASLQVESPHGRRSKVKAGNVLLEFERPSGAELLVEAQRFAAGLDAEFLWQCCGVREFGFQELAREYVGRQPSAAEATGVLMKLRSAPVYFYRRGRGGFPAAPAPTPQLPPVAPGDGKSGPPHHSALSAAPAHPHRPAPPPAPQRRALLA